MAFNREEYKSESITFFTFSPKFPGFFPGETLKCVILFPAFVVSIYISDLSTKLAFEDSWPPLFCAYDFSGGVLVSFFARSGSLLEGDWSRDAARVCLSAETVIARPRTARSNHFRTPAKRGKRRPACLRFYSRFRAVCL